MSTVCSTTLILHWYSLCMSTVCSTTLILHWCAVYVHCLPNLTHTPLVLCVCPLSAHTRTPAVCSTSELTHTLLAPVLYVSLTHNLTLIHAVTLHWRCLLIHAVTQFVLADFEEGKLRDATSAMLASVVGIVVYSPTDVLRTRFYNQPVDSQGKGKLYAGMGDAVLKISRKEGVQSFWKGMVIHAISSRG